MGKCKVSSKMGVPSVKRHESAQFLGSVSEDFRASKGCFESFKQRSEIHSVARHWEVASADVEAVETFKAEFSASMEETGYLPQAFNSYETGLSWRNTPRRTYINNEENALPGYKPQNERFTLLLGVNA